MSKNNINGNKSMLEMLSTLIKKNRIDTDISTYTEVVNSTLKLEEGVVSKEDLSFLKNCTEYLINSDVEDMATNRKILDIRNKYFYKRENVKVECQDTKNLKFDILKLTKGYFRKAASEFIREVNSGETEYLKKQTDFLTKISLKEENSYSEFFHLFKRDGSESPMFREFATLMDYMNILHSCSSINDIDLKKAKEIVQFRNKHIVYL